MARIDLIDTTIRDGNQSLWATRMTTAEALPAIGPLDRAGFLHLDVHSALHVDVCVRYLKEDPWDRVRRMKDSALATPLRMGFRSGNITGFSTRLPDDFIDLWVRSWRNSGIEVFWCHDGMINVDNIGRNISIVKRNGGCGVAPLTFSDSPVHTDEFYAQKTRDVIERYQADAIMIKDAAGLLTIERVRTLVPAILKAAAAVPVEIHSHCLTGLGPIVCLEAVKLGIRRVHTAIPPLANGASHPAADQIIRELRTMGHEVDVDLNCVDEVSQHFMTIAKQTNRPIGEPAQYNAFHYKHQIPGGMIANFKAQLSQANMLDRLDEVLAEAARVREELGWVIMVTPFSQLVGVQAMLNVISGRRYGSVPDEVKRYVLGHYGEPTAPIDPDVRAAIIANGSRGVERLIDPIAAVPGLRAKYPGANDEELILRYLFDKHIVDNLITSDRQAWKADSLTIGNSLLFLLEQIRNRPSVTRFGLVKGQNKIELTR